MTDPDLGPLDLRLEKLIEAQSSSSSHLRVIGTTSATVISALASSAGTWDKNQVRLIIVPTEEDLNNLTENLLFFHPHRNVWVLPGNDVSPYSGLYPSPRLSAARIKWLYAAQNAQPGQIFVASIHGLTQKTIPFSKLAAAHFQLKQGNSIPDDLFNRLELIGYHATGLVDEVGTYSRRGGILDIFSPSLAFPVRIELFGDIIESLRIFDPETQRSQEQDLVAFEVLPPREIIYSEEDLQNVIQRYKATLSLEEANPSDVEAIIYSLTQQQYFPGIEFLISQFYPEADSALSHFCCPLTVLYKDAVEIRHQWDINEETLKREYNHSSQSSLRPQIHDLYVNFDQLNWPEPLFEIEFSKIYMMDHHSTNTRTSEIEYHTSDFTEFREQSVHLVNKPQEQIAYLKQKLSHLRHENFTLFISTHFVSSAQRLKVLLENCDFTPLIIECDQIQTKEKISWSSLRENQNKNLSLVHILVGPHSESLKSNQDHIIFLNDTDFWGQKKTRKSSLKSSDNSVQRTKAINFGDIKLGDFIVHRLHGVGIYEGLKIMSIQGIPTEMIHLRYKDKDSLYLPIYRISQIQKYSGPSHPGFIDKLGGTGWEKTKTKVRQGLRDLAHELLQLYARRAQTTRPPFSPPSTDFIAFENSFPYEETDDQLKVMDEIQSDLTREQPMDRLVCGDVGFGKTELAMRAAFLAVTNHKQVALIAPTTVLTFQHTQSFIKRFKDWPIVIRALNRFVSPSEIKKTLQDLADGTVDIIIGTHRLLSKDIKFKNLGLLIIDEEQKFGVKHKETLRKIKVNVDTLVLSATPIPRTLNLSLTGIRDLSLLNTAPQDRLPTRTFVCPFDQAIIRKAVLAEIARGGQIFFIHNRVQSIYGLADELKQFLPEVRMAVAHGQMPEGELETTMVQFFNHEIDLLLCTTIVESGIDIPRANTMFINRADHFGLSQLYQLRGRVGRSKERAYCYLLVPRHRRLDADAQERLRVLQENTALGSGIRIAHYDLELRGSGDILGEDQSGQINAVGYELYMELMDEAIRQAKGEAPRIDDIEPEINLKIPAYIPDRYIPDLRMRLYYYKSLSDIENAHDIDNIESELRDQFGKPPDEVLNLLGVMLIRKTCKDLGIRDISTGVQRLSLLFTEQTPLPIPKVIQLTSRENKKYLLTPDNRLIIRLNNITWPGIYEELQILTKLCP